MAKRRKAVTTSPHGKGVRKGKISSKVAQRRERAAKARRRRTTRGLDEL
jgi:hypothetical protein